MELSEMVLQALRGRRGLDESDTSEDAEILAMRPQKIVEEYFAWHLGDPEWGVDAVSVVQQAYGITLD